MTFKLASGLRIRLAAVVVGTAAAAASLMAAAPANAATWSNSGSAGSVGLPASVAGYNFASPVLTQPARTVSRSSASTGAQWVKIDYRFFQGSSCSSTGLNCSQWSQLGSTKTVWTYVAPGQYSVTAKGVTIYVNPGVWDYTDFQATWYVANADYSLGRQLGSTWVRDSMTSDYSCAQISVLTCGIKSDYTVGAKLWVA